MDSIVKNGDKDFREFVAGSNLHGTNNISSMTVKIIILFFGNSSIIEKKKLLVAIC